MNAGIRMVRAERPANVTKPGFSLGQKYRGARGTALAERERGSINAHGGEQSRTALSGTVLSRGRVAYASWGNSRRQDGGKPQKKITRTQIALWRTTVDYGKTATVFFSMEEKKVTVPEGRKESRCAS